MSRRDNYSQREPQAVRSGRVFYVEWTSEGKRKGFLSEYVRRGDFP